MFLAPSVLSLDYTNFNQQLDIINNNCKYLHFDVMDGHFVPNLSFGPHIFSFFRRNSSLFLDVHLMVSNPEYFANVFIDSGADGITIHYECFENIADCLTLIKKIKNRHVKVGISIKPNTSPAKIVSLLPYVDLVLVMSVQPGFGGQKFIENSLEKIAFLNGYRKDNNLTYLIEVDGGVNDQNAHKIVNVGADILVVGSYIFNGDMKTNIDTLTF